uniref:Beta-defensin-like domain-containing protein n=1 Tax=Taeniopygia guttata TaxID=59729 RepID=A0A674H3L2_TAEGU
MKILFLLFPLLLLLVQGAAGSAVTCWRKQGFCAWRSCPRGARVVGICSPRLLCLCLWGWPCLGGSRRPWAWCWG